MTLAEGVVVPSSKTWAAMCVKGRAGDARSGPGSKKPVPVTETTWPAPVTSTVDAGDTPAGAGARSLAIRSA